MEKFSSGIPTPASAPSIPVKPALHIMPTIGRIVYHRGYDKQIRPAIVTHVHSEFCINAQVFAKNGSDTEAGIKTSLTHADPEQEPGCLNSWYWMPYQITAAKAAAVPS